MLASLRKLVSVLPVLAGVALLALLVEGALRSLQPLGNSDVYWQVRAGELALATGHVPDTDPFSYTIAGEPWNNHEWLFEIGAALLHRAFGWAGLRALVLVAWGGTAAGLAVVATRKLGAPAALFLVALFVALAGYKLKPVPQTVSMPLLLAGLYFFRGPRMLVSRRRAAALVAFLAVWGNTTAEAVTFLPFLVVDQIALRLGRREGEPPPDRTTALLLVLALLAPLANPPWSSVLEYALRGTATNREVNGEFTPLWAAAAVVTPLAKWAARAVVALFLPWAAFTFARSHERLRLLGDLGPALLATSAAILLERDLWMLVIPAATLLHALRDRASEAGVSGVSGVSGVAFALGLALAVLYALDTGFSPAHAVASIRDARARGTDIDDALVPVDCIDALAGSPEGTRLFTLRLWASYAIWRLPEVRVFYDGRNMEYGRDVWEAGTHVWMGGPGSQAILDGTHTDVVIAKPDWASRPGLRGSSWHPDAPRAARQRCAVFRR